MTSTLRTHVHLIKTEIFLVKLQSYLEMILQIVLD